MRTRLAVLSCLLLSGAVAAGCGDGDGEAAFSCSASMNGVTMVCLEGAGLSASDVDSNRRTCEQQGNTFSSGPCSRDRALGGCRMSRDGATLTSWYYEDTPSHTAEDQQRIRDICANIGAPFVSP